jgi:cobalt-zinc-cadmium efflux system protein
MSKSHHHPSSSDTGPVLGALTLIATFFVVEIVAAILGSSLVLFADAGHMITDVSALAMSAWALRLARRPAEARWTFGLRRAEILSAAVNGVSLVAVGLVILVQAVQRLVSPHPVNGTLVLVIALIGAAVNLAATGMLGRANQENLNIRGAYLHVVTDLFAFVATAIAGVVIVVSHWQRADAVASLVVVALMAYAAWGLLRDAGRILLQGTPDNLDLVDVRTHLTGGRARCRRTRPARVECGLGSHDTLSPRGRGKYVLRRRSRPADPRRSSELSDRTFLRSARDISTGTRDARVPRRGTPPVTRTHGGHTTSRRTESSKVETMGIEPTTSGLQSPRSTN